MDRAKVAFRTDASIAIGAGHLRRCLTLAHALRARGAECRFFCRALPGQMGDAVLAAGFRLDLLPAPKACDQPDVTPAHAAWLGVDWRRDAAETRALLDSWQPGWVVVDHYALDERWQALALPTGARLMVIDDLADRPHFADLLLDQNYGRRATDYDGLVPIKTQCLIGSRFALLRPEFAAARPAALARRAMGPVQTILVAMGGYDAEDASGRVLDVLAAMPEVAGLRVQVVLGGHAPHLLRLQALAATLPLAVEVLVDAPDMAGLIAAADLGIGGAGGSAWERCCLGLPTLMLTLATNQRQAAEALDRVGAAVLLGDLSDGQWPARFRAEMARLLVDPVARAEISARAAAVANGRGASRVAALLAVGQLGVRPATQADAEVVWNWRYAGTSARFYRNPKVPTLADHCLWFARAMNDPARHLLMITRDGRPLGHIRLDLDCALGTAAELSICLDAAFRGQGLALPALETAQAWAFSHGIGLLRAHVHRDNAASQRLFRAAGYRETSSNGDFLCYELSETNFPD